MKKLFLLLFFSLILANSVFAAKCPHGCLDAALMPSIISQGTTNYDVSDQAMLNSFMQLANTVKMKYEEFENISLQMFEENAKLQYMEAANSSNITFEANKMNELNSLEFDSQAIKAKKYIEVKIK